MKKITPLLIALFIVLTACNQATSQQQQKINSAKIVAEQFLKDQQIPGMAISVSHKGKLIWSEGFGFSDIEAQKKATPNTTQFRIASISKTITAVAMARLVDENKLDFDSSVYAYVPDFPKKKYRFTVRQIAGHTAGIRHYRGTEFLLNKKMSIVEGLDIFKNDSLLFQPGANYSYSTYGWNLLSVVVQNVSKMDFNVYMSERIFTPLQMKNTSLGFSDKAMPNRTLFYVKQSGRIKIAPTVNNEFKAAGGGFVSTSEDLILFGNEIINPKIISKNTISELTTPLKTSAGKNTNYGIGIGVVKLKNNTLRYAHSGGGMGATSFLSMYPEKELVITILTNLSGVHIQKLAGQLEEIFIE